MIAAGAPTPRAQTTAADEDEASLSSRLRLMMLRMSRRLRQESDTGISPSQLSALSSIQAATEASLGELAATERIAPPSMTRIVARLEDQGLVRRRPDASDRRVSRLEITDAGVELIETIRCQRDAFLADRLRRLTDDELEAVSRALPIFERLITDS